MPSSSSQQPVTQQTAQTRDPWAAAQPALQQALGSAQGLYGADVGYHPWTGETQAPLDPLVTRGLADQQAIATRNLGGTPGVKAAQALGLDQIKNQGLTPGINTAIGRYDTLYNEASGQENPYLQDILNTQGRRIGENVNSTLAGRGRYGSGMHTDVLARALAESADPILSQDYARRQQQRMQATGQAAGLYEQGLQRAGQWSQLMPTLDEAQYAPAERLAAIGQYSQDRAQRALDDQIKLYNAGQSRDWEQLARLNAIAGGAGGLGGSLTGTTSTPVNQPSTLQRLFGGVAAGAGVGGSFGGPVGAGVGAGVGGLLGMM